MADCCTPVVGVDVRVAAAHSPPPPLAEGGGEQLKLLPVVSWADWAELSSGSAASDHDIGDLSEGSNCDPRWETASSGWESASPRREAGSGQPRSNSSEGERLPSRQQTLAGSPASSSGDTLCVHPSPQVGLADLAESSESEQEQKTDINLLHSGRPSRQAHKMRRQRPKVFIHPTSVTADENSALVRNFSKLFDSEDVHCRAQKQEEKDQSRTAEGSMPASIVAEDPGEEEATTASSSSSQASLRPGRHRRQVRRQRRGRQGRQAQDDDARHCRFIIGIEEEDAFRVVRRVLGYQGSHVKRISLASGARLQLRGRGSRFLKGDDKLESTDPLTLCISAPDTAGYDLAVRLVRAHLTGVHDAYVGFCAQRGWPLPNLELSLHECAEREM